MDTDAIRELEDSVLATAKRLGWVIEDLNDNLRHGLYVRGPAWKARLNAETPIFAWTRQQMSERLAHWILSSRSGEGD